MKRVISSILMWMFLWSGTRMFDTVEFAEQDEDLPVSWIKFSNEP